MSFYWSFAVCSILTWITSTEAAAPKIDPATDRRLRAVAAPFAPAKTAEVDLELRVKLQTPPQELSAKYSLAIGRPNKFALVLKEGDLGASAYSDGVTATTFVPKLNVYSVQPAPADLRGMEGDVNAPAGDSLGSMAFVAAVFSGQPYEALLTGVIESKFQGRQKIGHNEFDRMEFKQDGLVWSLFSTLDEKPEIRRIEVTIPQMHMTMDFANWRINPEFPANRFVFNPPPDARKVNSVYDKDEEGEDSDLVGEPLPSFKLKTVDGASFETASLKGKAAILVCWAGEADHCVDALRLAHDLAAKNKAVAALSINIDTDSDRSKIQSFLARNKFKLKTALDPDRIVADQLEVDGVPMTFLVDKTGTIRKAWLGYHSTLPALVAKEIDALLGKTAR